MKLLVAILVVLALGFGIYYAAGLYTPAPEMPQQVIDTEAPEYNSAYLGVSFVYPRNYFVLENDLSTGEREQHSISLIEDTPTNRALVSGELQGTEGPTAITVEIFQNDLDSYTSETFIEETNFTNYKLSPTGDWALMNVGGDIGTSFQWSGLYEGRSVVVARPDWVYVFSVTWLTPQDAILSDFESVLSRVSFDEGIPLEITE